MKSITSTNNSNSYHRIEQSATAHHPTMELRTLATHLWRKKQGSSTLSRKHSTRTSSFPPINKLKCQRKDNISTFLQLSLLMTHYHLPRSNRLASSFREIGAIDAALNLCFRPEEARAVQSHFRPFYLNRLHLAEPRQRSTSNISEHRQSTPKSHQKQQQPSTRSRQLSTLTTPRGFTPPPLSPKSSLSIRDIEALNECTFHPKTHSTRATTAAVVISAYE